LIEEERGFNDESENSAESKTLQFERLFALQPAPSPIRAKVGAVNEKPRPSRSHHAFDHKHTPALPLYVTVRSSSLFLCASLSFSFFIFFYPLFYNGVAEECQDRRGSRENTRTLGSPRSRSIIELIHPSPHEQRSAFLLLPKTTNPWTYFAVQTNQILHRKAPSSLPPLLITASTLIGLASLLYFIGLVVRWRKGTLWVFRVVRVDDERFILPSYISSYALFAGLFDLCKPFSSSDRFSERLLRGSIPTGLQSFLWILYVRTEQDVNPKSYFLSTSLPW